MTDTPSRYKIFYMAEVDEFNKNDAEYRVALNKNLLQYHKTEVNGIRDEPSLEELDGNLSDRILQLDLTNPGELSILEDAMGKDAYLIEEFDWSGKIRLYYNRNTKTEIFKIPHISDNNKEFCMAIFRVPSKEIFMSDEDDYQVKVTETYCNKMTSFVGQISASFMKTDLEQNTLGDMMKK